MTRHLASIGRRTASGELPFPRPFPRPTANATMVERLTTKSPMGRMGRPEELKGALVFLASEASSYVTGRICSWMAGGRLGESQGTLPQSGAAGALGVSVHYSRDAATIGRAHFRAGRYSV